MRITTRRTMIAVALVAAMLYAYRQAAWFVEALDEPYYAKRMTTQSWDVGPAPDITVDCFEGSIVVNPATDGRVTAEIMTLSFGHDHQSDAEADVETIHVACVQMGDTLRITSPGFSPAGIRRQSHVTLLVPTNVRLDLRTGGGDVVIGWRPMGASPLTTPIIARSVRVRNDSPSRLMGWNHGDIKIATRAPGSDDRTAIPTRLQLDACGRIEVEANLATVEARAWHGVTPEGWTQAQYESFTGAPERGSGEGIVTFSGRLAGASDLRAAHSVALKLWRDPVMQIEAEATGGTLGGSALPATVEPEKGIARWSGALGKAPTATVRLRTDAGPIVVDAKP